jgi:hypothetical protein
MDPQTALYTERRKYFLEEQIYGIDQILERLDYQVGNHFYEAGQYYKIENHEFLGDREYRFDLINILTKQRKRYLDESESCERRILEEAIVA